MAISISYNLITTFSDVFMYNEDSEKRFDEWLCKQLPDIQIPNYRSPIVPEVEMQVTCDMEAHSNNPHDIRLVLWLIIDGNEDTEDWDAYDELINNQEFIQDIENNIVQPTIFKINKEFTGFTIPTYDGEFGDYIMFDSNTFYMMIYSEFSKGYHNVWNVTPMAFQVVDFEPDY